MNKEHQIEENLIKQFTELKYNYRPDIVDRKTLEQNFKAKFEKFLDQNHKTLKDEFSNKIDGIWTDLLWKHKEENVIDNPFTRYFYFITEILYFKNLYIKPHFIHFIQPR